MRQRALMTQPTLLLYFTRAIVLRVLFFAILFVSLLEILGLLDKMTPILERQLGAYGVAYYCILRLPFLFEQGLPLAALLGVVFLLVQMAQRSEIACFRAAGLSTARLYGLMVPAALVLALFTLIIKDTVSPRAESTYLQWWSQTASSDDDSIKDLWFRMPDKTVHVGIVSNGAQTLQNVATYHHDAHSVLTDLTVFPSARFVNGTWHAAIQEGWQQKGGHFANFRRESRDAPIDLPTPQTVLSFAQTPPVFSITRLLSSIALTIPTSQPTIAFEMALLTYISLPIKLCVMMLIALPVVYTPPRVGTRSPLPVAALAIGVLYLIAQGLLDALANAGTLPVLVSLVGAPIATLLLVWTWMIKLESG